MFSRRAFLRHRPQWVTDPLGVTASKAQPLFRSPEGRPIHPSKACARCCHPGHEASGCTYVFEKYRSPETFCTVHKRNRLTEDLKRSGGTTGLWQCIDNDCFAEREMCVVHNVRRRTSQLIILKDCVEFDEPVFRCNFEKKCQRYDYKMESDWLATRRTQRRSE